jgi:hypothetical protein
VPIPNMEAFDQLGTKFTRCRYSSRRSATSSEQSLRRKFLPPAIRRDPPVSVGAILRTNWDSPSCLDLHFIRSAYATNLQVEYGHDVSFVPIQLGDDYVSTTCFSQRSSAGAAKYEGEALTSH